MEKQAKPKNKILKFLPRAASAVVVSFQNPPFSPNTDKRLEIYTSKLKAHHHAGRGFSGPIISIIPHEARRKPKNGETSTFETQEPTSPKVSCMGQIKHKKTIKKAKPIATSHPRDHQLKAAVSSSSPRDLKKHPSVIRRIFTGAKTGRNSDASAADHEKPAHDRAPSLSQMKRFSSRRDSLPDFEWTAQIMPIDKDHRDYYSDEERDQEEEEEEEEGIIIPFSAPIMMVGGGVPLQPRKEINLWKRRTMAPPIPLELNLVRAN
ncbi:hypothetical protein I3760_08G071100 [Carya illinoinensis]|uniref:Syringolide-induced protein 14-1-1 n=1 Tax=Carya illinoinensis TaxID=32201 RepID=A0A8T1PS80_CARIL|nr:uncharacterized protein At1g76070-like [Carya illinoinensis]KAG2692847.1 hypothetical protein I3760_08G071100 [Carya illinoinensis]KAG6644674.1 hypothetical protein CIPAW_08G069200 [Carya illinoinensis]